MTAAGPAPSRTVAFFADGGFLAHVTRAFEIGRALARRGHRVVFFLDGPYADIPAKAGFEVRPVFTVDRAITMKLAERAGLCSLSWWRETCERSVDADLEALDALKPDAVVGDMHWSLCTSARVRGIPYVAVTNGGWTRWYAPPIGLPEGHAVVNLVGERVAAALFPGLKRFITWYYALGYTHVRKRYKLPPVSSLYDLIEGDVTLLADLPEFMPTVPGTPGSFRHVGPVLWEADLPEPAWLARLDPARPTIYFTMGSTGDTQFFREAIRVFGNTEYQILITTGGLTDIGPAPDNVFVEKYAPGRALLARSQAVVSHGGNGTVYQALSCGVPIIGFPTIFDQEFNMQRVVALGAGVRLSRRSYDAGVLRRAVDTVLQDDTYRRHAGVLARRIAEMHGPDNAADAIDALLARRV